MSGDERWAAEAGFGNWLRDRGDPELAALLTLRPDLMTPAPAAIDVLASRAGRRPSLQRALDDLDQFALRVIDALLALPSPVPCVRLAEELGVPQAPLVRYLDALSARAIAWQIDGGFVAAPGLRAAVSDRPPRPAAGLDRVSPEPPALDGILNGSREADQAAAAAALTALRCVDELLTGWAAAPPPVLRSGGLGIRALRKSAAALDLDVPQAALYTEVAREAGLLAASSWSDGEWLPSIGFDHWRDATAAERWVTLVSAWLATTRVPGLVGSRDDGGRLLNVLGTGLDRMDAPRIRAQVLRELADLAPGTSASAQALVARLAWRWPRRPYPPLAMLTETATREAALLGLTGMGALSGHGRAVASGGVAEAGTILAAILPEPVSHVVLQADLTAVAPGPLTAELARELSLAANVESTGGATVYRFSAASVRRALDAGRSGAGLLALLDERSRTPVPQPLRYLIEDVARGHGRVRVGAAAAYIRCDDPAVAAEIAADRRAVSLHLRFLAPTVLVSSSRRGDVLAVLRRLGYAPAAESANGAVEITAPASRRAEDRAGRYGRYGTTPGSGALPPLDPWPNDERARVAVQVLRSGQGR